MGRPERALDPDAGLIERFAYDLRQLREAAGRPTYRAMAQRAGCGASTLSEAAKGQRLPTLQTTLDYVRACGVRDTAAWERRWEEAQRQLDAAHELSPAESPGSPAPGPSEPATRSRTAPGALIGRTARSKTAWLSALAVVVVVLAAALAWPSGPAAPPQQATAAGQETDCREPFQLPRLPIAVAPCIHGRAGRIEMSLRLTATSAAPGAVAYLWLHDVGARTPLKHTLHTCPLEPLTAGEARTCGPFALDVPRGTYSTAATVEPGPARLEPPHWQSGATGTQSQAFTFDPGPN